LFTNEDSVVLSYMIALSANAQWIYFMLKSVTLLSAMFDMKDEGKVTKDADIMTLGCHSGHNISVGSISRTF
jgi:hypothetical protein